MAPSTYLITLTRFHVPLSDTAIPDIDNDTEAGRRWITIVRPLVEAPGHSNSAWGRLKEKPEEVLLRTVWKSREALDEFEASPGYEIYLRGLSSSTSPAVSRVIAQSSSSFAMVHGFTALRTVYFPYPVTPEQREKFDTVKGLQYAYGLGPGAASMIAYRYPPAKGWVEGPQSLRGQQAEAALYWHFWKNEAAEQRFISGELALLQGSRILEEVRQVDHWEDQLRGLGAVEWFDEHCDFGNVPTMFYYDT